MKTRAYRTNDLDSVQLLVCASAAALSLGGIARGSNESATALVAPALSLSIEESYAAPDEPAPDAGAKDAPGASTAGAADDPAGERVVGYGLAGSNWLRFGGLYASDFSNDNDLNVHISWSRFLVDDVEFVLEGAGWYFNQEGQDTGGVSGSFLFRWHFWHAEDRRWTVFADAGIGLLAGFDEVPDGGTGFNFLPRLGVGFTRAFNESVDGESRGARWEVGVRWHHISNGRIEGDARNPARDSLAVYAGIVIPF